MLATAVVAALVVGQVVGADAQGFSWPSFGGLSAFPNIFASQSPAGPAAAANAAGPPAVAQSYEQAATVASAAAEQVRAPTT